MPGLKRKYLDDNFIFCLLGNQKNPSYDLHINEWVNSKDSYIDFGLRIYDIHQVKICCIYIPFYLSKESILDLSQQLNIERVARGIFNANCISKPYNNSSSLSTIEYNNRTEHILPITIKSLHIKNLETGTLIYISLSSIKKHLIHQEVYMRFRIPHSSMNTLFRHNKKRLKTLFSSPLVTDSFHHFIRVNEARLAPGELRSLLSQYPQNIKKVIVTLSIDDKYNVEDSGCFRVRPLEPELFKDYAPKKFPYSKATTYQWITENKKHYYFNIKMNYSHLLPLSFVFYSGIVIVYSIIGNWLWNWLSMLLTQ